MTCGNPRCQHEFCWLCLHDWTRATHDASFCTGKGVALGGSGVRGEADTLQLGATAHDTRPAEDTDAKEELQRFRVALTIRLESDFELLSAEDAHVPLRWRRILEFYDHLETRIRATAQVVFACVVDSHRAQHELFELLSWVRDRWWLRLSPEDVDAHNESIMDPQSFLELPCPVRRRMRAERALVRLEQHGGRQLVEYERNMAERTQQEVGANRAEITSALEAVTANNAQLVAQGNVAFEQRDRALHLTATVHTLPWRCRRTFVPTLRLASLRFAISPGGSSTGVPAEWNDMPASTVKCLQRLCAKRLIASSFQLKIQMIVGLCADFFRVSMKSLLWLWLIVAENTEEECETVFCTTGIKVLMVSVPE